MAVSIERTRNFWFPLVLWTLCNRTLHCSCYALAFRRQYLTKWP